MENSDFTFYLKLILKTASHDDLEMEIIIERGGKKKRKFKKKKESASK